MTDKKGVPKPRKSGWRTKVVQAKPHKPIAGPNVGRIYSLSDVDEKVLCEQLLKDDVCNWIVLKGMQMLESGKTPGKNMIYFLQHLKIIK